MRSSLVGAVGLALFACAQEPRAITRPPPSVRGPSPPIRSPIEAVEPHPPVEPAPQGAVEPDRAAERRAAWLGAEIRGGCCTDTHGLGPAHIEETPEGVVVTLAADLPMRCLVDFGTDGRPLFLRRCRLSRPWIVRSPKITLRCATRANSERCSGRYRIGNARYHDEGSDSVTLVRAAAESEPP